MSESVILGSPVLIVLFSLSFILGAFALNKKSGGYFFPILSAVVFSGGAV